MPVIPPGYVNCVLDIFAVGDPGVMNVSLGVEVETPPWTFSNSDEFIALMASKFLTEISTTAYASVGGTAFVGSDGDPIIHDVSYSSISGAQGTDALPQNAAVLIRKRSDLGGRKNAGRLYIPGFDEDFVDNIGMINSVTYDSLVTTVSDWLADFKAASNVAEVVILHTLGTDEPTVISSFTIERQLATQRRRLRS